MRLFKWVRSVNRSRRQASKFLLSDHAPEASGVRSRSESAVCARLDSNGNIVQQLHLDIETLLNQKGEMS